MKICKKIVKLFLLPTLFSTLSSFSIFPSYYPMVELEVRSDDSTNHGTPLYMIVKEVEKGEFLKNDYHEIVQEASPNASKKGSLKSHVILPGKSYELEIPRKEEDKVIGVYFLYTHPGEDWKMLIDATSKVTVMLGENQISKVKIE